MTFNKHSNLEGLHAFLGCSQYHWINYSQDKLIETYSRKKAAEEGTELHDIAAKLIQKGIKLPNTQKTLNMYVNDGIGYKMTPEQALYYSFNCFGTADTISFRKERGREHSILRIHDLKTGVTPAHMEQLMLYAALFCLEYDINPNDIDIELRIYQNNERIIFEPEADEIRHMMDRIVTSDKILLQIQSQED